MKVQVADETASKTLVLWGVDADIFNALLVPRGACVRVEQALGKTGIDGKTIELQSVGGQTTLRKINDEASFPKPEVPRVLLGALRVNLVCDLLARVLESGDARGFETNGRKGQLSRVLLGDSSGMAWAVGWDDAASALEKIQEGDVVLLEGVSVKPARQGDGVEVHANAQTRVLFGPKLDSSALPAREALLSNVFPKRTLTELFELRDGTTGLTEFVVTHVEPITKTSGKDLDIARFSLSPSPQTLNAVKFTGVAFGAQAKRLDTMSTKVPFEARAVLEVRKNTFENTRELLVRHWLSL